MNDRIFTTTDQQGEALVIDPSAVLLPDGKIDRGGVIIKTTSAGVCLSVQQIVGMVERLQHFIEGPEASMHIIVLDENGWIIQHAAGCRSAPGGVTGCLYSQGALELQRGEHPLGRYRAGLGDRGEIVFGERL